MAKNLTYQFCSAVENGFRPGMDKHSAKAENPETTYKIYSYGARSTMIDMSHLFGKYMKENFPTIKQVRNITVEHINSFLAAQKGVSKTTLSQYVSRLNKLELCCEKKFGIDLDWKTGRILPESEKEKVRDVVFTDRQIATLEKYFDSKKDCLSKDGYYLAKAFSLRASEVVNIRCFDVKLDQGILHIHGAKGGRNRDIEIRPQDVEMLKRIMDGKRPSEKLIPLKTDTVCCYINRACKKLGFNEIVAAKTSVHCLRKYSITNYYKEKCKEVGPDRARELAMLRLGHSKDRMDLFKTYIKL